MAKILTSKCKLCRRAGTKLFLKGNRCTSSKCAMIRKSYAPGVHGATGGYKRGLSEYGRQLAEKQKLKRIYGLSEKQLKKMLNLAEKKSGVLGDNLLFILESRLDNVIYRLGLAQSRNQSRQLVSHSLFQVNGKNLNIASALLKIGDVVSVKETKLNKPFIKEIQMILKKTSGNNMNWLEFDAGKMKGKIIAKPNKDEIGASINLPMVIEFYSR